MRRMLTASTGARWPTPRRRARRSDRRSHHCRAGGDGAPAPKSRAFRAGAGSRTSRHRNGRRCCTAARRTRARRCLRSPARHGRGGAGGQVHSILVIECGRRTGMAVLTAVPGRNMVAGTSCLPGNGKEAALVKALQIINLRQPSAVREFPYGKLELFFIAGQVIGRATYQPGWRWTQHVGPTAGAELCEVEHLGLVVSGRAAVRMADGTERVMEPGDLFAVPPGHDSWVVGDEPYTSLHLLGADSYPPRHELRALSVRGELRWRDVDLDAGQVPARGTGEGRAGEWRDRAFGPAGRIRAGDLEPAPSAPERGPRVPA